MRPTFFGIEIARTGLTVSQKGLDVSGHNIANVDTAGYTRQRLVNTAYEPYSAVTRFKPVERGLVGSGAHIQILDQIRDAFLDRQFRSEQTLKSEWDYRTQGLTYIEALFEGDVDANLSKSVKELFDGFIALVGEGNDGQQRKFLQQQGIKLAADFNHVYDRLVEQQQDQNLAVQTVVDEINTITAEIAVLNKSIYSYELDGQPANDLRDKRNLLLDHLSALVPIEYHTGPDDKFVVTTSGHELVNHLTVSTLGYHDEPNAVAGGLPVSVPHWNGVPQVNLDLTQSGGELLAHINLRDNSTADAPGIPYFIERMNNLARAIAETVNRVHAAGYTHPSSGSPSQTGINFFEVPAGGIVNVTAGNLKVSAQVLASVYNIAASTSEVLLDGSDPSKLQAGNQENARALFAIYNRQNIVLSAAAGGESIGSLQGYISSSVLDIAVTLSHSKKMASTQGTLVLSADNQRLSISGVSLDEEMTNLLKYQHAYAGSSRVITTMDEALDTLINRMGLVGRS